MPQFFSTSLLPILALAAAANSSAQTLSVLSGDGQITVQNFVTEFPLVVQATNASGQPMSGVSVNFSLSGPGNLVPAAPVVTDANGQASVSFVGATIYGDNAFTQSTVTASTGSSSATFHVTTSGEDLTSGLVFVAAQINSPMLGQVLTGPSGGSGSQVVQVYVYGVHQAGVQLVPNVAVRLIPENPNGPSLACAQGTGVTDQTGIANCRVIFSGPPGTGIYDIQVGGYRTFNGFSFTVTQGSTGSQAETINIIGGTNQSGPPGSQLLSPLTARIQNASGTPLPNVPVIWQPSGSVTLTNVSSTSDANGVVSATVILGSATGASQVTLRTSDGAAQVTFAMTATTSGSTSTGTGSTGRGVPAAFRITGGSNQSGTPGSRLPAALTAQVVDASGNPVPNVSVVWQTGPAVSLSNVVSTSDANGTVSAVATLGFTTGNAQVQVQTGGSSGGIQTPFGATGGAAIFGVFNLTVAQNAISTPGRGQVSTIRIAGGNNQSAAPGTRLTAPLQAQVVDASGNPLSGVAMTWLPGPSVYLSNVATVTDGNGFASATATLGFAAGLTQVQVQAGSPGIATPFGTTNGSFVVGIFSLAVSQGQPAAIRILGGANQSGVPGARLAAPLQAQIVDSAGNPIPNVTVTWSSGPSLSLTNVVSVSDANGVVSAIATLGATVGSTLAQVQFGAIQASFTLSIAQQIQIQPAGIQITGGNNQTAAPGAQLLAPLSARVVDAAGNPVANVPVIWTPLGTAPPSLTGLVYTSDANGYVSAIVTLPAAVGPAQVQLRLAAGTAPPVLFTMQGSLTLSGLTILTGSNQSTQAGSPFPENVTVQLFALEGTAAGFPVQLTSTGAAVVIGGGGTVVTDATGRATITVQAGSTPGVAILTVAAGNFTGAAYLVIQSAQPAVNPLTVQNGASNLPLPVSPAEIVKIYGAGIAPGLQGCVPPNGTPGPAPYSLSGVQVQFSSDGGYSAFAPLFSLCNFGPGNEFAVVETPVDLPMGMVTIGAQVSGAVAAGGTFMAAPASPGIFEIAMSDGNQRAILQRQDGSYVSLENPAQPGETLTLLATGLGKPVTGSGVAIATDQTGIDGDDAPAPVPIMIQINGEMTPVISSAFSKSTLGIYLVTFAIPSDAPVGTDISLTLSAGTAGNSVAANPSSVPVQAPPQ